MYDFIHWQFGQGTLFSFPLTILDPFYHHNIAISMVFYRYVTFTLKSLYYDRNLYSWYKNLILRIFLQTCSKTLIFIEYSWSSIYRSYSSICFKSWIFFLLKFWFFSSCKIAEPLHKDDHALYNILAIAYESVWNW